MKLSFVIPCYRSEKYIANTINEIRTKMLEREGMQYEIIAVNDGSPDNVFEVLKELSMDIPELIAINLSTNFGQENARMAGLRHTSGEYIVCLDDDGQCPINDLWKLIEPLENGMDMSIAKYPIKKQSRFKNWGSYINSKMTHWLLKMPKDIEMSNFFAFNRMLCNQIVQYVNPYPFITGLVFRSTQSVVNVQMEERERTEGTTGYTLRKLLALWLNGFTNFSVKPLRIADVAGMIFAVFGFLFGIIVIIRKLLIPDMLAGYASIIAAMFFIGGLIMVLLGLVGEYIGRIFICLNQTPQYVIREIVTNKDEI